MILGLLSHEDLSGYEIKRRIDSSLSYFWGASYGSIYPTLKELVEKGYAQRTGDETNVRNRQVYNITASGREYLKAWLAEPVMRDEIRYETLLKLFFGKEAGREQTAGHIRAFREKTQNNLQNLLAARQILEDNRDEDETHQYYLLTVMFGIRTYRAYLDFCDEALSVLETDTRNVN